MTRAELAGRQALDACKQAHLGPRKRQTTYRKNERAQKAPARGAAAPSNILKNKKNDKSQRSFQIDCNEHKHHNRQNHRPQKRTAQANRPKSPSAALFKYLDAKHKNKYSALVLFAISAILLFQAYAYYSSHRQAIAQHAGEEIAHSSLQLTYKLTRTAGLNEGKIGSLLPSALPDGRYYILAGQSGQILDAYPKREGFSGKNIFDLLSPSLMQRVPYHSAHIYRGELFDQRSYFVTLRTFPVETISAQGTPQQTTPHSSQMLVVLQDEKLYAAQNGTGLPYQIFLFILCSMLLFTLAAFAWKKPVYKQQPKIIAPPQPSTRARTRTKKTTHHSHNHNYNDMIANAQCGEWQWEYSNDKISWSPGFYALLGLAPRPHASFSFASLSHSIENADRLLNFIEHHVNANSLTFRTLFKMRHANGQWCWIEMRAARMIDQGSAKTIKFRMMMIDVTAQRREHALAHKIQHYLQQGIEISSDALVIWDAKQRLIFCNQAFLEFYGLRLEHARPGMAFSDVLDHAQNYIISEHNAKTHKSAHYKKEYEAQLNSGQWLLIKEEQDKSGSFISVATDITAKKKKEEQTAQYQKSLETILQELGHAQQKHKKQSAQLAQLTVKHMEERSNAKAAHKAKSSFLANMSHELRTPLNAIIGFAEMMQHQMLGPLGHEKYQEYTNDILKSGRFLHDVVGDILDMSRIEAEQVELSIQPLGLGQIISQSLEKHGAEAQQKNISVEHLGLKDIGVLGDEDAMQQIIDHLLSNAIKFTPVNGTIRLRLAVTRNAARISIQDTGVGIAQKDLAQLAHPFTQVEKQYNKKFKGSGLGLAIARGLIELQNGEFSISSKLGDGTNIICHFPLSRDHNTASSQLKHKQTIAGAQKHSASTLAA